MPRCFVIQPFDGDRYDKRYKDVFAPAIKNADLEPYRVDRDPSVDVPIEDIERGIEDAGVCLAEISTDNPNVWYELGYAIARKRSVILVCSDERTAKYPFDVHHRKVIQYSTQLLSDFETVRSKITERLKAVLKKQGEFGLLPSLASISRVEGLEQYELAGLVAVAQEVDHPEAGIGTYSFRESMQQMGFTKVAGTLALDSLIKREMLELNTEEDYNGNISSTFSITPKGMDWLSANKENLTLEIRKDELQKISDADIPF